MPGAKARVADRPLAQGPRCRERRLGMASLHGAERASVSGNPLRAPRAQRPLTGFSRSSTSRSGGRAPLYRGFASSVVGPSLGLAATCRMSDSEVGTTRSLCTEGRAICARPLVFGPSGHPMGWAIR